MGQVGAPWTRKDIQTLRALAQKQPTATIASHLGRTICALTQKAHELKVSLRVKRKYRTRPVPPTGMPEPRPAGIDLNE